LQIIIAAQTGNRGKKGFSELKLSLAQQTAIEMLTITNDNNTGNDDGDYGDDNDDSDRKLCRFIDPVAPYPGKREFLC
jgi:hypothetical protein